MKRALQITQNVISKVNWSLSLGMAFFVFTLILVWQGYVGARSWLETEQNSKITKVVVHGEPAHTTNQEIVSAIRKADLTSFFKLDVNQVQKLVTDLPWVLQVSVRKQWPDTVKVFVTEHQAVAIWNHDLLLNTQGDVFQAPVAQYLDVLPHLYGPEGSEHETWQTFTKMNGLFELHQMKMTSLALSERFSWQLYLDNGVRLNLGRKEKVQRVQRFIDLYPQIKNSSDKEVEAVDLRYDTGLAVSWKQSIEDQEQEKSKV